MPKISVLVPAYETKEIFIEDLILSLEDQSYTNYELIIADASETDKVKNKVEDLNSQYGNIYYYRLDENKGISENSNKALQYVTGEYVALLDHDDVLTPDALYEVVNMINKNKDAVLIYSDEDKGSVILASHNRNTRVSYFKYLENLSNNDIVYLYYKGKKYQYSIYKSEIVDKVGTIKIKKDSSISNIVLISCKNGTKDKQIVYLGKLISIKDY
jgi:LPXTG-site transpeptidase (sortase) family protein